MSWSRSLVAALAILVVSVCLCRADDQALWKEYGLVHSEPGKHGKLEFTAYRFKDLTGALAAWEWQRSPQGKSCDLAPYCTTDGDRTVIFEDNYIVVFDSAHPGKADVDAVLNALPNRTDTVLPAILTFVPRQGLVPDSARYVLGWNSLKAFAPELAGTDPGFTQGAEAQVAEYQLAGGSAPVKLAIFYYPTPDMARAHAALFKTLPKTHVKRSGVLVAIVYGGANERDADTLLSRVQYEAKITWNDTPPPPPMKPLYRLLWNIIYLSCVLAGICLLAGLMYAAMRMYRRRYGKLEEEEAMTTLHLNAE